MTLVAAGDTILWSLFERSWIAAEEIEGLLLAWFALLGAAWGVAEGLHLAVGLAADRLPERGRAVVERIAAVGTAGFGLLLAVAGWKLVAAVANTLPGTGLPARHQYLPTVVAGVLIVLFALERLFRTQAPPGDRS